VSWIFTAKLLIFYLHTKYVPIVVIQHHRILINARACISLPFQRYLNAQIHARILIIENWGKCPIVVIQHHRILINARACISLPFQRYLNAQVHARILIIENWGKCLAVTKAAWLTKPKRCYLLPCIPPSTAQFLMWGQRQQRKFSDISDNRRKSMNHWRQKNGAKFGVHCTEIRRGSCAGSVKFLCARNTFESSSQNHCWNKSVACTLVLVV